MSLDWRNGIVLLSCLTLMVTAQILWKIGLARVGTLDLAGEGVGPKLLELARDWRIVLGVALFAFCTLLWFDLLSRFELSFLYPFMSLTYVLAFFAGWLWLGEQVYPMRLAGIGVICVGIYLVSRTGG